MTVKHILERKGRDVVTMQPTATLAEAAQLLAQKRIGAVVLLDGDGKVNGILSERDIVRLIGTKGISALEEPVSKVMTLKVVTCPENTTVIEAMEIMTERRFRHLPVIEEGKLVGLVSIGDIVAERIARAEQEAEDIRNYIATS
ncbi:CBS domain-containing protein [Consotaella salsifontis]|uniref:CBS domain-containing protein n=1 Tax=Consotaella salsifontis TaxID=1365950 RepID=A0A1T4L7W0_9HYPH|nr:CBS domain-containing protein [Consotaella salsifontis]SJZ50640.1 CBS domain-containing protein [Consotaella salsifontis]